MPQDPQKKSIPSSSQTAAPSRGFLSRMFGTDPVTPEMQQGIDIAKKENPNLAPVETYGPLSRMIQPRAMGYTSPGNTIYLNPNQVGQSPQDWADTLLHEQTHVNQQSAPGYHPTLELLKRMFVPEGDYGQRPAEMEAFQAEKDRRARMGRPQTPYPSFSRPGEYNIPQDINLPNPVKKPIPNRGPVTMK